MATTRAIGTEEWERVFEVDLLGVWRTCRAALPQIVERRGQLVLISSVYAFANGMINSPYAVAKAGVESMGRTLRTELMPQGASATVAYFGWVDTKLVQDGMAQEDAARLQRIHARLAAEADHARRGRGRAGARDRGTGAAGLRAQVVALRLRACAASSMPLLDRRMERDEKMGAFLRDLDAKSGIDGPASGATPRRRHRRGDQRALGVGGHGSPARSAARRSSASQVIIATSSRSSSAVAR